MWLGLSPGVQDVQLPSGNKHLWRMCWLLHCRPELGQLPVVGFCFSFPLKQKSVNHGTLIKWNKGFTNSGSVDEDPTDMLEAALARQGMKVQFIFTP